MYKDKKILAIIPARGGSKGLPGKNIKPLLGKPLIGWTIEQAFASEYIDEIFVSTDSREIADIAETFGVRVPELRPEELASDISPSSEFVIYTIEYLQTQGKYFDYIILLEPTSPLRKKKDVDHAIEILERYPETSSIVSLGEVHTEHPAIVKKINPDGKVVPFMANSEKIMRRQDNQKSYFPYGVIYMVRTDFFQRTKSFYSEESIPYFIERWQNYEVDDLYDFICIEAILKIKQEDII